MTEDQFWKMVENLKAQLSLHCSVYGRKESALGYMTVRTYDYDGFLFSSFDALYKLGPDLKLWCRRKDWRGWVFGLQWDLLATGNRSILFLHRVTDLDFAKHILISDL